MPEFGYRQTGSYDLPRLGLNDQAAAVVANVALAAVLSRISRGLNVNDSPAPPLTRFYERYKQQHGKSSNRDWNLTGQTIAQLRVLSATPHEITIGFGPGVNAQTLVALALWNRGDKQMMGLSSANRQEVAGAIGARQKG